MTEPLLLDVRGAARQLSCSPRLVQALIYAGRLESVRLQRRRLIPAAALEQFVQELRADARESAGQPSLEVVAQ